MLNMEPLYPSPPKSIDLERLLEELTEIHIRTLCLAETIRQLKNGVTDLVQKQKESEYLK